MSQSAMGIDITLVSTDQQMPLGFIYVDPASANQAIGSQGRKEYIYVKASENIGIYDVCVRLSGTPNYGDPSTLGTGIAQSNSGEALKRVVGVAIKAIPANSYGFIQRKGIGWVVSHAAFAVDGGLIPQAAGRADDNAGITDVSFGIALAAATGAGQVIPAYLDCEG